MIAWLGTAEASETRLAGGKAAALSLLAASRPVPPGFVLTTAAFPASGGLPDRLPSRIAASLATAYARLAEMLDVCEPAVAVRSSGADEDGAAASFAGQHESYLNVRGPEALFDAVLRCWASALAPRALAYRAEHGLQDEPVRLAVLVQELVAADAAGVAFSVNPVSGRHDEVVVTANYGLGESVVAGSAVPDTWVLSKQDLEIVSVRIGAKERMSVPHPGGTREVAVPALLRNRASVPEADVRRIASLVVDLEQEARRPIDAEVALSGGRLLLLQSRPVTTLAPAAGPEMRSHIQ